MDVVIVGAGPTGLLLAGDLATAGVDCMLVERRTEESSLSRAFAVHARTLEVLDARGAADALLETGTTLTELRLTGRTAVDLSRLRSRYPLVLVTPQYQSERLLAERARAAGAVIRHGVTAVGLRQDADGVQLDVRDADGGTETLAAQYVVGADGVRSTVRDALGLPFPGQAVVRSMMLADVRLAIEPGHVLTVDSDGEAFAFVAPFGDGWYRVIAWDRNSQAPDSAPVDLAEIRAATLQALGTDFGMHSPRWLSRFHSDERQVPSYRVGRVFLAGDAAHVHSPAGGQGLNTSIQDAANLSWKLAAAVKGWAPDGLLGTYHTERHPVGERTLRLSGALLRATLTDQPVLRAGRDALTTVVTMVPALASQAARMVSGIGIRYPAPPGAHPLTGARAPDVRLGDGRRLYEALRDGKFVLVGNTANPVLAGTADGLAGRLSVASVTSHTDPAVLVRPDGYIAWAGTPSGTGSTLAPALAKWCGVADPAGAGQVAPASPAEG